MKTFHAATRQRWRTWLASHHDSESEIWLIFHKKHTGKPAIAYKDALDEALCYGWIDSLVKRIDDNRYARKFTPRRTDSNWSSINIRRYNELKALKRLAAQDPEAASLVQLRYFAGLTLSEAADSLGISPRSAGRLWAYARAWLRQAVEGPADAAQNS